MQMTQHRNLYYNINCIVSFLCSLRQQVLLIVSFIIQLSISFIYFCLSSIVPFFFAMCINNMEKSG